MSEKLTEDLIKVFEKHRRGAPVKGAGLNEAYEMVAEFQRKMGQPVAEYPAAMGDQRQAERFDFMLEELTEFFSATELVDQVDGLIDLIYLAIGTLVELGVKPQVPFQIVQDANMSKLWPDGKPRINENGKVVKPPTFVRPEPLLEAEIERQKKGAK